MKKNYLIILALLNYALNQAQIVNIPDANFKNALLNHSIPIDTNNDNEIQVSEAQNFNGTLHLNSKNIYDLTGISNFINAEKLSCLGNNLTQLDLTSNTAMVEVNCSYNNLTQLILPNQISKVYCSTNNIANINLDNLTNLTDFYCDNNNLSNLNISNNNALISLVVSYNNLTSIDTNTNSQLEILDFGNNNISSIELSNNLQLKSLNTFSNNSLNNLDISVNQLIINLNCSRNNLTDLDVSTNINLKYLTCSFNNISSLNLVSNNLLESISCRNNILNSLDVRNGNNGIITNFNSQNNNLICIYVDNALDSSTNWIDIDNESIFVETEIECNALSINQSKLLLDFLIYPIPTKNVLNIKSKTDITKLVIYSELGKKIKETTVNKINVSTLSQGLYFIKVEDVNGNFGVKKFIKR